MSNKQTWATIILSFILLTYAITCASLYAPATTNSFAIEGELVVATGNGPLTISKVSGTLNSKILDLILLMMKD